MLCHKLEELRAIIGGPLIVMSGYRCPAHNVAIRGVKNSYHMKGMAAHIKTFSPMEAASYACGIFGGVGIYDWGIHVDTGPQRTWDERCE